VCAALVLYSCIVDIVTGTPEELFLLFSSVLYRKLERKCPTLVKSTSFQMLSSSSLSFILHCSLSNCKCLRERRKKVGNEDGE